MGTRGIGIDIVKQIEPGSRRPYRGVEPYRQNVLTLVSIARARGIEVFLCTQIFNREYEYRFYRQRLWADAVDDVNEVTRSFGDRWSDVHVIDAAAALPGSNDWMTDYCHFTEDGKVRLARLIARAITPHVVRLAAKRRMESMRVFSDANDPSSQGGPRWGFEPVGNREAPGDRAFPSPSLPGTRTRASSSNTAALTTDVTLKNQ